MSDFQYDGNGNTVVSNTKPANIAYDPYFNLPSEISGNVTTRFKYDGAGERIERRTLDGGGPDRTFYIRGLNDYPLIEKDPSPANTRLYVYGVNGLIAVQDNNIWYFAVKDHLGSTRILLNQANNAVVARYHYSPYGRTMWAQVSQNPKYRFTGQCQRHPLGRV